MGHSVHVCRKLMIKLITNITTLCSARYSYQSNFVLPDCHSHVLSLRITMRMMMMMIMIKFIAQFSAEFGSSV